MPNFSFIFFEEIIMNQSRHRAYLRSALLWIFLLWESPICGMAQQTSTPTVVTRSLHDALLQLKEHFHVDILFDAELVKPCTVPSDRLAAALRQPATATDRINTEAILLTLVKPCGLTVQRVGEVLVIALPAAPKMASTTNLGAPAPPAALTAIETVPILTNSTTEPAQQQERVITGTVLDDTKQPLRGVNVRVKQNPAKGAVTDREGKYRLTLAAGETTLQFSLVGYEKLSAVEVGDRTEVNVQMEINLLELEPVLKVII
jgi:hypothetical protein